MIPRETFEIVKGKKRDVPIMRLVSKLPNCKNHNRIKIVAKLCGEISFPITCSTSVDKLSLYFGS